MALLGQFALWAAFILGLWCVLLSFSGRWQGRPDLSHRCALGGFVLALGGIITMWPGGGTTSSAPRRAQAGYGVTLVGAGSE